MLKRNSQLPEGKSGSNKNNKNNTNLIGATYIRASKLSSHAS